MASDRNLAASRLLNKPLYLQVRDLVIERISKGEWKPGNALPNEVELAREFGLSTGTIRKALDHLETERAVTRRQGRGTYVVDQSSDALVSRFWRIGGSDGKLVPGDLKTFEFAEALANEEERRRLHLGPGDLVYRIHGVCLNRGLAFMIEDATIPVSLFPGLLEKKDATYRIGAIAQQYGLLLGRAQERVSIASAPATIASTLRVALDTPVMQLDRLLMALDGRPLEWRIAYCHLAGGCYLAELG